MNAIKIYSNITDLLTENAQRNIAKSKKQMLQFIQMIQTPRNEVSAILPSMTPAEKLQELSRWFDLSRFDPQVPTKGPFKTLSKEEFQVLLLEAILFKDAGDIATNPTNLEQILKDRDEDNLRRVFPVGMNRISRALSKEESEFLVRTLREEQLLWLPQVMCSRIAPSVRPELKKRLQSLSVPCNNALYLIHEQEEKQLAILCRPVSDLTQKLDHLIQHDQKASASCKNKDQGDYSLKQITMTVGAAKGLIARQDLAMYLGVSPRLFLIGVKSGDYLRMRIPRVADTPRLGYLYRARHVINFLKTVWVAPKPEYAPHPSEWQPPHNGLYSAAEIERLTGFTAHDLRYAARAGRVGCYRISTEALTRYSLEDVEDFLSRRTPQSQKGHMQTQMIPSSETLCDQYISSWTALTLVCGNSSLGEPSSTMLTNLSSLPVERILRKSMTRYKQYKSVYYRKDDFFKWIQGGYHRLVPVEPENETEARFEVVPQEIHPEEGDLFKQKAQILKDLVACGLPEANRSRLLSLIARETNQGRINRFIPYDPDQPENMVNRIQYRMRDVLDNARVQQLLGKTVLEKARELDLQARENMVRFMASPEARPSLAYFSIGKEEEAQTADESENS